MGLSWAAVDSIELGLKGRLIALYVSLGIRLNLHKVWWDELAWVRR